MAKVFGVGNDKAFLDQRLIDWKYFEPAPEWNGSRSYVLCVRDRIAAHGGVLSTKLLLPHGVATSVQIIDWAADKSFPGVGFMLLEQLAAMADVCIGPGGSIQCTKVLRSPNSRHDALPLNIRMSCVIRPWQRLIEAEPFQPRAVARMIRDSARRTGMGRGGPAPWTAIPATAFDDPLPPSAAVNEQFTPVIRTAAQLNYMLRCPAARVTGYVLQRDSEAAGHLLFSQKPGEIRIADLQIRSTSEEDWRACFCLALQLALKLRPKAWLVSAMAMPELIQRAALRAGFRNAYSHEAFVMDPRGMLTGHPVPNLSMIDTDAAYL